MTVEKKKKKSLLRILLLLSALHDLFLLLVEDGNLEKNMSTGRSSDLQAPHNLRCWRTSAPTHSTLASTVGLLTPTLTQPGQMADTQLLILWLSRHRTGTCLPGAMPTQTCTLLYSTDIPSCACLCRAVCTHTLNRSRCVRAWAMWHGERRS